MIAELGHYALILALLLAIAQSVIPLVGASRDDMALMAVARPAAIGQLLFVGMAFLCLTYAFVASDFSVLPVAANSHTDKPLIYKISGVWGNHEGSMVLWVLILAVFGAAVALFGHNLPPSLRARALAVQGMIGAGFLAFILFSSNPFARLDPAPPNGNGLNPLLQDPGLAAHPPFLYLGYVGFSMAFAFAIAALLEGKVDAAWARWVRPWTLAAWCFLTLGIALGSIWAYYELGWGGWWYWDPVENASFMPWLIGTALLHSAIVVEKRDALKRWTILLAILTFSLSLLGTFLVRSGVITSVHAFATDPTRGIFILLLLGLTTGGGLTLYAIRAPSLKLGGLFSPVSREGSLVLNNILLVVATGVVLFGTLYPLFIDVIGADKLSVGPPFFNIVFLPLFALLVFFMAIGPFLAWKRGNLGDALFRLRAAAVATVTAVAVSVWLASGRGEFGYVGLGLAAWVIVGTASAFASRLTLRAGSPAEAWRRARGLPRAAYGMYLAHAGIAITIAGISAMSIWQEEKVLALRIGESVSFVGYEVTLEFVNVETGPNYEAEISQFGFFRNGGRVIELMAERRFYPSPGDSTTEAGIISNLLRNLYVAVGEPDGSGAWTVRLYYHPLVPWIWLGAFAMTLGGALSLSDRRHRVGAPRRGRLPAAQPAAAE